MDVNIALVGPRGAHQTFRTNHHGRSLGPAVEVSDTTCVHVDADFKKCTAHVSPKRGDNAPHGWLCHFHASEVEKAHREILATIGKAGFKPSKRDDYNFVPAPEVAQKGDLDLRVGRSFSLKKRVWSSEPEPEESDDDLMES